MRTLLTVNVDQPAAAADWFYVLAAQSPVRIESITATLTTGATVGTRAPALLTRDQNGQALAYDTVQTAQAASTAIAYNFRPGNAFYGAGADAAHYVASCPGFWLPPNASIRTLTGGLVAGDQWSAVTISYLVADELLIDRLAIAAGEVLAAG